MDVAREYVDWEGEVVTRKAERVHHTVDNQINATKEAIREGCRRFDERKLAAEQEMSRLEKERKQLINNNKRTANGLKGVFEITEVTVRFLAILHPYSPASLSFNWLVGLLFCHY